ncbi:MAG: hypothetical protein FWG16_05120 [Micrococcales bacterium]|nr:hypothetical protein [Micrococcales bacterium]
MWRSLGTKAPAIQRASFLVLVFLAVHCYMIWLSVKAQPTGSIDVDLYEWWVQQGQTGYGWMGLDWPWVYPLGAWLPMGLAAGLVWLTGGGFSYLVAWCLMVVLFNLVACFWFVRVFGLSRAWLALSWWLVFLALLGPVGIARFDAVIMPLVLVALLVAGSRPALASALVTVGAWIKVAPGVVLAPLVLLAGRGWTKVVAYAAGISFAVVGLVWLARGDLGALTSFFAADAGRGLQLEAVLATPVVLGHAAAGRELGYYDYGLSTVETWGAAADVLAQVATVGLPLACLAVAGLTWLARHRPTEALLYSTQALFAVLIVFNKTGSPQFYAWLAPTIVVALASQSNRFDWWLMAGLGLVAAVLSWFIFPTFYGELLAAQGWMLAVLGLRNLCAVLILALALRGLWRLARQTSRAEKDAMPKIRGTPSVLGHRSQWEV